MLSHLRDVLVRMGRPSDEALAAAIQWIVDAISPHDTPDAMARAASLALALMDAMVLTDEFDRYHVLVEKLLEALPPEGMLAGRLPIRNEALTALRTQGTVEGTVALGARQIAYALIAAGHGDDTARRIADGVPVWQALPLI